MLSFSLVIELYRYTFLYSRSINETTECTKSGSSFTIVDPSSSCDMILNIEEAILKSSPSSNKNKHTSTT